MLLNHPQMLDVLVCFEEQLAGIKLNDDAANRPNVTNMLPLTTA
jgi:hypothetical protein